MRTVLVVVGAVIAGLLPGALLAPASAANADLSASISVSTGADGALTITAGVFNAGPDPASHVMLTVPLPAGVAMAGTPSGPCAFDPSQDAVVCNSVVNGQDNPIPPQTGVSTSIPAVACTTLTNATVGDGVSSPDDANSSNNNAMSAPFSQTASSTCADVSVSVSGPSSDVSAGNPFSYTITVANAGPADAGSTTVTDVVPSGLSITDATPPPGCSFSGQTVTCSGPNFAPNTSHQITIDVVAASTSTTESLSDAATVQPTAPDGNLANNKASVLTTVDPSASGSVPSGGGTVSTGTDATPTAPIETAVTLPDAGTVTITESPTATAVPTGYTLVGTEVVVSSSYTSSTMPLTITFYIDATTLANAGLTYQTVAISRDGVVLSDCSVSSIPCVLSRSVDATTGNAVIAVSTDHASHWDALEPPPPYPFQGFFSPVRNAPSVTTATAGTIVPVKFSVGGQISGAFADERYGVSDCATWATPSTFTAAPGSLAYNTSNGRYTFSWQTAKSMAGSCVVFKLALNDGTTHLADVKLTK